MVSLVDLELSCSVWVLDGVIYAMVLGKILNAVLSSTTCIKNSYWAAM